MPRINEIDRRILETMTGRDRIKALLREQGMGLKEFAEAENEWVENVSRCIGGGSPHPEIREKLAARLDLTRPEIDRLIDGDGA